MIEVSDKDEFNLELKKNKSLLVLFYASWCPYCRRIVPFFDQKVVCSNGEKAMHVILDDYDNPLWDDFDVGAVPTVILFENGKVRDRLDGQFGRGLSESRLESWLAAIKFC
jgi:thioredoxin 1